jgi:hypothetical protein
MTVFGGVVRQVARADVHDARFIQHSFRIELRLVWVLSLIVAVATTVATSVVVEGFGVTWAGLTSVGDEVGGARALPSVAGVAAVQILAVMVLSRGPLTRWIASHG